MDTVVLSKCLLEYCHNNQDCIFHILGKFIWTETDSEGHWYFALDRDGAILADWKTLRYRSGVKVWLNLVLSGGGRFKLYSLDPDAANVYVATATKLPPSYRRLCTEDPNAFPNDPTVSCLNPQETIRLLEKRPEETRVWDDKFKIILERIPKSPDHFATFIHELEQYREPTKQRFSSNAILNQNDSPVEKIRQAFIWFTAEFGEANSEIAFDRAANNTINEIFV